MSTTSPRPPGARRPGSSAGPPTTRRCCARLRVEWAPLLAEIGAGTLQRELDGELPVDAVRRLKKAGFGAIRVPVEHGGRGATLPRAHPALDRAGRHRRQPAAGAARTLRARRGPGVAARPRPRTSAVSFERFAAGEIAGNAWSEVGSTTIDTQRTTSWTARPTAGYRLDGTKYYTTGSIFAEWADVYVRVVNPAAADEADDDFAIAIVDTRTSRRQRQSTTGTASASAAPAAAPRPSTTCGVPAANVLPFAERFPYQTGLYQLNLLATLAGIGRAALSDVVNAGPFSRTRNYSHANAPASARRRAGARQDRRHRCRRVRRRGGHHPGGGQPPGWSPTGPPPLPSTSRRRWRSARSSPRPPRWW